MFIFYYVTLYFVILCLNTINNVYTVIIEKQRILESLSIRGTKKFPSTYHGDERDSHRELPNLGGLIYHCDGETRSRDN